MKRKTLYDIALKDSVFRRERRLLAEQDNPFLNLLWNKFENDLKEETVLVVEKDELRSI